MAEITKITTHVSDAKDRLLEQYRDSEKLPNFHTILEIFSQRFQDVENILEDWNKDVSIFDAVGMQLDKIGTIVGLARVSGQNDATYRALLFIKIMQNNAQGTGEQLINVTKLLTGATVVQYVNLFNATLSLYLNVDINPTNDPDVADFFYSNIQSVLMSGVGIDSIRLSYFSDEFLLGDALNPVSSSTTGLSSTENYLTSGGRLVKNLHGASIVSFGSYTYTSSVSWKAICYSEDKNLFVAVGSGGGTNNVMTSQDGYTWTVRTLPLSRNLNDVCYAPSLGLFVAISTSTASDSILTSTDGITWTARNNPLLQFLQCITWSPELSLFVALSGDKELLHAVTSPDGITWTARSAGEDYTLWKSICWSAELGLFVGVSNTDGNIIITSPDGINWTNRTAPFKDYKSICWSPELNLFIAVATHATNNTNIMKSSDGINWSLVTQPTQLLTSVIWVSELGRFFACSSTGSNQVISSVDGNNWTTYATLSTGTSFNDIVWSTNRERIIGVSGSNKVLFSYSSR